MNACPLTHEWKLWITAYINRINFTNVLDDSRRAYKTYTNIEQQTHLFLSLGQLSHTSHFLYDVCFSVFDNTVVDFFRQVITNLFFRPVELFFYESFIECMGSWLFLFQAGDYRPLLKAKYPSWIPIHAP